MKRLLLATAATLALAPSSAWADAEGPGTPQATAANATFLSNAPVPPSGRGVCVIDSGVDTDTDLGPALAGRVAQIGGINGDPSDLGTISDTGEALPKHGTLVAGIVASQVDGCQGENRLDGGPVGQLADSGQGDEQSVVAGQVQANCRESAGRPLPGTAVSG